MSLFFVFFKLKKKKDTICINEDRYSLANTGYVSNGYERLIGSSRTRDSQKLLTRIRFPSLPACTAPG